MQAIPSQDSIVYFNQDVFSQLNLHIAKKQYSKIVVIVDTNTFEHCYPYFIANLHTELAIEVIEIEAGEEHKTIDTCVGVWNSLSELNIDRKALLINLGGGVVTDLGGFVACTYKRGVSYINVPTSLLAMVDASVGGKTGVDLGSLKNQIGVINTPEMVLVHTQFLNTLPGSQLKSGMAEVLKHGLINSIDYWKKATDFSATTLESLDAIIYESVQIKNEVVTQDPNELGLRKTLNFGHTLGHAVESYFLEHPNKKELLHGEAVAIGIILACFLSTELTGFSVETCNSIKETILSVFERVAIEESDIDSIIELTKYDKKNSHGNVNFVLLREIGNPVIDITVPNDLVYKAFNYYLN